MKDEKNICIRLPATSANLAAGFDTLGMAVDRFNTLEVFEGESFCVEIRGFGENTYPKDMSNPAASAFARYCALSGYPLPCVTLRQSNDIPGAGGLGSSATAYLGGLLCGEEYFHGGMSGDDILYEAALLEGHPDNAAPCLMGGITAAAMDREAKRVRYVQRSVDARFHFACAVPGFTLPTEIARQALPREYKREDAVFNLSRVSLVMEAFAKGDADMLSFACRDALHQQYRAALIPGCEALMKAAGARGACASYISGAGPSIMAVFAEDGIPEEYTADAHALGFGLYPLHAWNAGYGR